jgi:hypothetical protein
MDTLTEAIRPGAEPGEFIYAFLSAYDFPSATITQVRNNTGTRNVASRRDDGHVALRTKLYFMPVSAGESVHEALQRLADEEEPARHRCRFLIVTDYQEFTALDTRTDERLDIAIDELPAQYLFFGPLAGLERTRQFTEQSADLKAAAKMGKLFDRLHEVNEVDTPEALHALNVFLTRLLFCYFAEDTGIFPKDAFTRVIAEASGEDGEGLTDLLAQLFEVMNLEAHERPAGLPAHITQFPYVNGGLFRDALPVPAIRGKGRRMMIECGQLAWEAVNPDIFGSMFQAVVEEESRDSLGQHYTSVPNILKVIRPLFLDGLYAELEKAKGSRKKLEKLLERVGRIRLFDPAMGSGNFLIIAYKELRRLEMATFRALQDIGQQKQNVIFMSGIRLDQFYGIEIDDFAHEIAQLSLWLSEHQMNTLFAKEFGHSEPLLPLKDSANLVLGNSLRLDWNQVCPIEPGDEVYVCGNPPFMGSKNRSAEQNADMVAVFSGLKKHGYLDYVASFFYKGAKYIVGRGALAFVTTNSICQGEQVALLWPNIQALGVKINFAYQSFVWRNSAKGNAGVHVAVIGLSGTDEVKENRLFQLMEDGWHVRKVPNISPYLLPGPDIVVQSRTKPLVGSTKMVYGNKPVDGGHLILDRSEKEALLARAPEAEVWIKRILGAREFLNGEERWCLWLANATMSDVASVPAVYERVKRVEDARLASRDPGAVKLADRPHQFRDLSNPESFILVPRHTSFRRRYAPVGFFGADVVTNDAVQIIPYGTLFDFGVITSSMHMAWLDLVCGRIKSDYRYSGKLVYNTFPWPDASKAQRDNIEQLGRNVLLTREMYPDKTLAQLYDPSAMPEELFNAHSLLDEAVEHLYRDRPFRDLAERQEYLLARYEALVTAEKQAKGRTRSPWATKMMSEG